MAEEAENDRKNGRTTGGRFAKGNPGRTPGARHKVTLAMEALLDGEAEALTRKAVEMALAGDATAMRLCLERLLPVRKGRTVGFPLPDVENVSDVLTALSAVVAAVANGEITPEEAVSISSVLEIKRRTIESVEFENRLNRLEAERNVK